MLKVRPADPRHVGPIGDIIDRGAAALGFEARHPLRRNAEGCDGQGLCQFGCPTDAKQSTNVSYIPGPWSAAPFCSPVSEPPAWSGMAAGSPACAPGAAMTRGARSG